MNFWSGKSEELQGSREGREERGSWPLQQHNSAESRRNPEELDVELIERFGQLHSALSVGTKVEGKLAFDKPVRIDGELKGEIMAPKALVLIGSQAKVEAHISAACLVVMGQLVGSVEALERMEMLSGASVQGSVNSPCLIIQEGALFNGNCEMKRAACETAASKRKPCEAASSPRRGMGEAQAESQSADESALSTAVPPPSF